MYLCVASIAWLTSKSWLIHIKEMICESNVPCISYFRSKLYQCDARCPRFIFQMPHKFYSLTCIIHHLSSGNLGVTSYNIGYLSKMLCKIKPFEISITLIIQFSCQIIWKFVSLLCYVQNLKMIWQLSNNLWTTEISRYLSFKMHFWWISSLWQPPGW